MQSIHWLHYKNYSMSYGLYDDNVKPELIYYAETEYRRLEQKRIWTVKFYKADYPSKTLIGTRKYNNLNDAERAMYLWCLIHKDVKQ